VSKGNNAAPSSVPEAFRDELQTTTAIQRALGFLPTPPKAWLSALAEYRRVAWEFQRSFSLHLANDVAVQRQYVSELGARTARFAPGMATQDLKTSLESAQKNLAGLEALLNANPDEAGRIERAAHRAANARRLQDLSDRMNHLRLAGKPIDDGLLDQRVELESVVAQDNAAFNKQVVRQTAAGAEIAAARRVAIESLVDALSERIVGCAEDAAEIMKPRLAVHRSYPRSIPSAAVACWHRAIEIANAARALDPSVIFDLPATFKRVSPRCWQALGQVVMRLGSRPKIEPEQVETRTE